MFVGKYIVVKQYMDKKFPESKSVQLQTDISENPSWQFEKNVVFKITSLSVRGEYEGESLILRGENDYIIIFLQDEIELFDEPPF